MVLDRFYQFSGYLFINQFVRPEMFFSNSQHPNACPTYKSVCCLNLKWFMMMTSFLKLPACLGLFLSITIVLPWCNDDIISARSYIGVCRGKGLSHS